MHTEPAIPAQEAPAPEAPAPEATEAAHPLARQLAMLAELGEASLRMALEIERRCIGSRAGRGAPQSEQECAPESGQESAPAQVEAAGEPDPEPVSPRVLAELTLAFYRASRAMRMTVALQFQLMKELQPSQEAETGLKNCIRVEFIDPVTRRTYDSVAELIAAERAREELHDAPPFAPVPAASAREVGAIVGQVARAGLQPGESSPREATEIVERLTREAVERLEEETEFDEIMRRPVSEIVEQICRDLGLSPDWPRLAEEDWARAELESGAVGRPLAPFSSPASGGGGPRSGGGGANAPSPDLEPPASSSASPPWPPPNRRPKPH